MENNRRPIRILLVEDDPVDAELLLLELQRGGFEVEHQRVETEPEFIRHLSDDLDVVLSDYNLPQFDGLRALQILNERAPDIPFILVSGRVGEETAVEAMKKGAVDYLLKDRLARLSQAVGHAIEERRMRETMRKAEAKQQTLQERLRQAEKLELVGQLVGGVAHDFNNLLTAILGYPQFIRMELGPEHPVTEFADEIEKAAERAAQLTRQLLAFSSKQQLKTEALFLAEVVEGLQKMLRRLIPENIDLRITNTCADVPVMSDRGQLEQVLLNLVINARDALPDGGLINIETDALEISSEICERHPKCAPGMHVVLRVRDSGIGMEPGVVSHIFEPFFTTKPAGKGTGLGLATCYGIVRQFGGFIDVQSEPGRGSTFSVFLPAATGEIPDKAAGAPEPMNKGSGTVLVVEDEQSLRTLIADMLRNAGYRVIEAHDGKSAVQQAQEAPSGFIDLAVVDMVLPDMNGLELQRLLGELPKPPKILFTSGYSADTISSRHSFDGDLKLLEKPFTPLMLTERVRELLGPA